MAEGELRTEPMSRTAKAVVLGVLAVAVGPPALYLPYAGRALDRLEVAGTGYALEPAGRLVASDDGPLVTYRPAEVLRIRLRVPVRNTSRLPLHVRHETGDEPGPGTTEGTPTPTTTVRVGPGETAWLTFQHTVYGCPGAGQEGAVFEVHSVEVLVRARATDERRTSLRLPVPYRVPLLPPGDCAGGTA
ncbi:MAG TPA: hypothetical protein VNA20_08015 [Frankiaceae bacterium]|nr:hypothetical protein [Frankiaceae bacterium]